MEAGALSDLVAMVGTGSSSDSVGLQLLKLVQRGKGEAHMQTSTAAQRDVSVSGRVQGPTRVHGMTPAQRAQMWAVLGLLAIVAGRIALNA